MRHVTMADPLGSRVLVIEGGRPRGGTIIGGRERVGEPSIHVKLDPLEESGPVEYRTLPASEVWIDTAALERWADAETRYRLAEELRRRAEDERERCTCGHSRRAHHAGGVDDGGCTACECTAYADQIERLTRERDKARDELDGIAEVLDAAGVPQVTDGPDGRRWTLGPGARVEHVIAERDEALAEVEELRTRAAAQLEIETRARDAARAEVEKLRALPSAEDLEERAHEILDGAGIPTHALDPVSGEEDYRAGLEERLEWTVEEITRLRRALEPFARFGAAVLLIDGGSGKWHSIRVDGYEHTISHEDFRRARAALAGEGEAPTCTWTQDDEGVWHTACRSSWLYPDGGSPADHRQVYCHACGQRVEAEPHAEGEDEEPAPEVPDTGPEVVEIPSNVWEAVDWIMDGWSHAGELPEEKGGRDA